MQKQESEDLQAQESKDNKPQQTSGDSLAKNTVMLYLLTASSYVFGFATIPYLTRVLGAEAYGIVGYATAVSSYFQLFLDFGFLLSATGSIAKCNGDKEKISKIVSGVIQAKACLIILGGVALAILCAGLESFRPYTTLFFLYFAYVSVNTLIPDFLYRGIEKMQIITIRTVAVKAFFLICIFLFVHSADDILLVPLLYLLGALGAVVVVYAHAYRSVGIRFGIEPLMNVVALLKDSAFFFISRIASTFYSSLNMLVLGTLYPGTALLGNYSAVDKAISAGKAVSSPVADSLYPYMMRTKNFKLMIKVSLLMAVALTIVCIPCWIFAYPLCGFVFGAEYWDAGCYLRILLPLIPITVISYIYGFPALAPLGKSNFANLSVVLGAVLQVVLLLALFVLQMISVEAICTATVITELFVAMFRFFSLLINLRKSIK